MQFSPAGDRAVLITLGRLPAADLHAAARRLRAMTDTLASIVGEESLYVIFRAPPPSLESVERVLTQPSDVDDAPSRRHSLRVTFAEGHAPDLAEFLAHAGISRDSFFDRLPHIRLTARFLGFRAGFAYLDGWPADWRMPRRPTSRLIVPRGSFAVAGEMAGFYPIDTPGGWNILGRTDATLWDPSGTPPNLIAAGDEVAIQPTGDLLESPEEKPDVVEKLDDIEIVSGPQLTVVVRGADYTLLDQGRAPGGPFDERAAAAANRAVGNSPHAPLLECAMVGPRVRFRRRRIAAWFGAQSELPREKAFIVEAGQELTIGRLHGMRGYLAVGAPEFAEGQALLPVLKSEDHHTILVAGGPHDIGLGDVECEVTPLLNRVGIRLRPLTPIAHRAAADLKSCGMQLGTLQLHPDGSLVAMGPDHPITGGYLQPLTVLWDERWKLGQVAPGDRVRFVRRAS